MYLTVSSLGNYLVHRGLVSTASIVDSRFRIAQALGRNHNFLVEAPPNGWFVKQVASENPRAVENLRREAGFYRAVNSEVRFSALVPLLPRFIDFDADRRALTIENVQEACHLGESLQRRTHDPVDIAETMAIALSACHGIDVRGPFDDATGQLLRRQIPGMLRHGVGWEPPPPDLNAASRSLLNSVLGESRIVNGFRGLIDRWQRETFIHGDLRLTNCLLDASPDGPCRIRLIDWEEVDVGDAAWDVGGVFNGYVLCDVLARRGIPFAGPSPLDPAVFNLNSLQPAIAMFWRTYIATRGLEQAAATALLERSIGCAGAWAVQSALERALLTNQLEDGMFDLLEIAGQMLAAPRQFAEDSLSLQFEDSNRE